MNALWSWLVDNKEWVFSGLGVFLLSSLVASLQKWREKRSAVIVGAAAPPKRESLEAPRATRSRASVAIFIGQAALLVGLGALGHRYVNSVPLPIAPLLITVAMALLFASRASVYAVNSVMTKKAPIDTGRTKGVQEWIVGGALQPLTRMDMFTCGTFAGIVVAVAACEFVSLNVLAIAPFGLWIYGAELVCVAVGTAVCVALFTVRDGTWSIAYGAGHSLGAACALLILHPEQNNYVASTYLGGQAWFVSVGLALALVKPGLRSIRQDLVIAFRQEEPPNRARKRCYGRTKRWKRCGKSVGRGVFCRDHWYQSVTVLGIAVTGWGTAASISPSLSLERLRAGRATVGTIEMLRDATPGYVDVIVDLNNPETAEVELSHIEIVYIDPRPVPQCGSIEPVIPYFISDSVQFVVGTTGEYRGSVRSVGSLVSPVRSVRLVARGGRVGDNACRDRNASVNFAVSDVIAGQSRPKLGIGIPTRVAAVESDSSHELRQERIQRRSRALFDYAWPFRGHVTDTVNKYFPGLSGRRLAVTTDSVLFRLLMQEYPQLMSKERLTDTAHFFGWPDPGKILDGTIVVGVLSAKDGREIRAGSHLTNGGWSAITKMQAGKLLLSANTYSNRVLFETLMQLRPDVNLREPGTKRTPLHTALGRSTYVSDLLAAGAHVNAPDSAGNTPLHESHDPDTERLIRAHATIDARNYNGETALFRASREGDGRKVNRLLRAGASPRVRDNAGQTSLHAAARSWDLGIVGLLLGAGAVTDPIDSLGRTPLQLAVAGPKWRGTLGPSEKQQGVVNLLLGAGADVRHVDRRGQTALHHIASTYGDPLLVRTLCRFGAFAAPRDSGGRSPLALAEEQGDTRKTGQPSDSASTAWIVSFLGEIRFCEDWLQR